MEKYLDNGKWIAWPIAALVWIASSVHVVNQLGWFIGVPIGIFTGMFYAGIAYGIAALLWPLIGLGIVFILVVIFWQ